MPLNADSRRARDYAERICRRLPGRLQALLKAAEMTKDALGEEVGRVAGDDLQN